MNSTNFRLRRRLPQRAPDWDQLLQLLEEDLTLGNPGHRDERAWRLFADRLRELTDLVLEQVGPLKTIAAADLVQDVLCKLHSPSEIRRLRGALSPEEYLVILVRNAIVDQRRRERSEFKIRAELDPTEHEVLRPSISLRPAV